MKVKVRIYGDLVAIYGRKHLLVFDEKTTIRTLTKAIANKASQSRDGYLGEFKVGGTDLAIMVNGKNITLLDGLNTLLKDGDDVVIMPFVVGG
jgi:molybdopterin converting factor small subunit